MKGKMTLNLLNKDKKKLYVEVEVMYRKYKGYLCKADTEVDNSDDKLEIGKHRVDFERIMNEDRRLMKKVCVKPEDVIDLYYNHNNKNLKLHLEKIYEGHYDGFQYSPKSK